MSKKSKKDAKAIQEFLAEAQEIAELLGRNLMSLEREAKDGYPDPDLVNEVFRGIHTLKSLSGTFGVEPLSTLAHHEENLLDDLRLGKVDLTTEILDILFESIDLITHVLAQIGAVGDNHAADGLPAVDGLISRLQGIGSKKNDTPTDPPEKEQTVDPESFLAAEEFEVLTEYEEHRLRTNLERGVPLFKIHTRFKLDSIDKDLDAIKTKLKPLGEIITYLPSSEEGDPDRLEIEIVFALQKELDDLKEVIDGLDVELKQITFKKEPEAPAKKTVSEANESRSEVETIADTDADQAIPVALEAADEESSKALSMRSVSQTVRVDIKKLDRLMNVVGELAIVRNSISQISEEIRVAMGRRDLTIELHRINRGFERRLAELREGILEVRMVPLTQMLDRLNRMIRKISRELKKEVNFVVAGAKTEVDKLIIEELSNPLMHIMRNAIDHGIEGPKERHEAGKPEVGTVALTAYQKGNHVLIEIEDDGRGIDTDRIIEVAVERQLITAEYAKNMSVQEITDLVFLPGMSTATHTTEISGRGVGMDVVKTHIASIGGVVEVESDIGIGTKFIITLPVTLAIIPALLVSVGGRIYAVPINTVSEALFISTTSINVIRGTEAITFRGKTLFLCRLGDFFELPKEETTPDEACVIVTSFGHHRLGLVVDNIIGQEDVVIKSLGKSLNKVEVFAGVTDIGDQRLALVLDTARIIEKFQSGTNQRDRQVAALE